MARLTELPVIIFTCDQVVEVIESIEDAELWIEAVDVESGEFDIAYLTSGEVLSIAVDAGAPKLTQTHTFNRSDLVSRLESAKSRFPFESADPAAYAENFLVKEYRDR